MSKLRTFLETAGITQAKFADQIGVTQGAVSKLCHGGEPSLATAEKIAAATRGQVPITAWPNLAAVVDAARGAA